MNAKHLSVALCATLLAATAVAAPTPNAEAKLHKYSTVIEKERPELNEATRTLIADYRRDPSEANLAALREQVAKNYDAVLARKKAKLEELKLTAKHASKVEEMQAIVDEMVATREKRIEQSLRRFKDPRLMPGSRDTKADYLPVIGAGLDVSIARFPVTNADYAAFAKATGLPLPEGCEAADKARHPVVNVSYADAVAYCAWLTGKADGKALYRLPTEEEWSVAAGHMPKDADFNCGVREGTAPVDAYASTLAACGAADMWGNCWEWTSTNLPGAEGQKIVKGGSWKSRRTDCRTEEVSFGREAAAGADDVGFRVVKVASDDKPNRPKGRGEGRAKGGERRGKGIR